MSITGPGEGDAVAPPTGVSCYAYTFDRPDAFGFVCIEHPVTRGVVVTPSGP